LDHANIDLGNKASLQRGAKYFVNYCLSCHSAAYQRYNRMGADLGLTEQQVLDNLIFTTDEEGGPTKVGALMDVAMNEGYAKEVFGVVPPNLALTARSRGVDWLYTYLRTFYLDETRPLGVNNLVFPGVGMPHVLWELQGWQKPVYEAHKNSAGEEEEVITGLEIKEDAQGSMNAEEYDSMVRDLVNFLAYLAEPGKSQRQQIGVWVILFLLVFLVVAFLLKKEYWKDIH
jgi:ubiquinol-cytochrome c reductase cytochrome c1 subunit